MYCVLPLPEGSGTERVLPRTALQHAVERENMELVTLLVNAGANANAPATMDSGATALQIASIRGSIPMVQYLIKLDPNIHADGATFNDRTALQGAAEHGRKDVVELLLEHNASAVCQHRDQLVDAVFYAEKNAQHVVARILRERVSPPWGQEDEETIDMLEEDWESDSEHWEICELGIEIETRKRHLKTGQSPRRHMKVIQIRVWGARSFLLSK
ncbi:ankyrin repeat-containing domain protein [Diaporthe sp. PMI_573]|nr:ankyrin repeat-containing domain protein [Diaporthaceae sp. PMI_573]